MFRGEQGHFWWDAAGDGPEGIREMDMGGHHVHGRWRDMAARARGTYFETVRDNFKVDSLDHCQGFDLGEAEGLMRLRKPNQVLHFPLHPAAGAVFGLLFAACIFEIMCLVLWPIPRCKRPSETALSNSDEDETGCSVQLFKWLVSRVDREGLGQEAAHFWRGNHCCSTAIRSLSLSPLGKHLPPWAQSHPTDASRFSLS